MVFSLIAQFNSTIHEDETKNWMPIKLLIDEVWNSFGIISQLVLLNNYSVTMISILNMCDFLAFKLIFHRYIRHMKNSDD